jgi:hypothetical protein
MARNNFPAVTAEYVALLATPVYAGAPESAHAQRAAEALRMLDGFLPAIEARLAEVNGRATSHTLGARDVVAAARETEARLEKLGVPKKARGGAELVLASRAPTASSYKYRAIGTFVTLRRDTEGNWMLVEARRLEMHPKQSSASTLRVSAEARDAIVRRAMAGIVVLPAAEGAANV